MKNYSRYIICFVSVVLAAEAAAARISQIKCEEFAKKLKTMATPNESEALEEYAAAKQLPFTALIGYGKGIVTYWMCGATMISGNYLVSAAQCGHHQLLGPARLAWLGDLELGTMEDDARTNILDIDDILVYPGDTENIRYPGIALFKLQIDLEPTLYIRPACLYQHEIENQLIAPGWGAHSDAILDTMRLKVGRVRKTKNCSSHQPGRNSDQPARDDLLCVIAQSPTSNMCQSDSGGGLLTEHRVNDYNMWSIIGVNSIGGDCLSNPAIFINISSYIDWIEYIVWHS